MNVEQIFYYIEQAEKLGASDVHLKCGSRVVYRLIGEVEYFDGEILYESDIFNFLEYVSNIDPENLRYGNEAIDFSFTVNKLRLRGNAYKDNNGISVSLRLLKLVASDFQGLGIPEVLKSLCDRRSGLILITGPTGSGKTTTLTYMLEYINHTQKKHVIMLEDPIEFIHTPDKCIFSQREIGRDTTSFSDAIAEAVREDPDVIMVGEMRDKESMEAAIRAAETGHLVISTLHTKGAVNSVSRIVDVFPAIQQNQIRTQLSMSLLGVVSQQLCPSVDGKSRYLATEVMLVTDPVKALMKQDKIHLIGNTLQTSMNIGMHTMRHSLDRLLQDGKISKDTWDAYQIV